MRGRRGLTHSTSTDTRNYTHAHHLDGRLQLRRGVDVPHSRPRAGLRGCCGDAVQRRKASFGAVVFDDRVRGQRKEKALQISEAILVPSTVEVSPPRVAKGKETRRWRRSR